MSIICVGDLHGKIEIAEGLLQDKEQEIIFIGDFLDSFDRTTMDQLKLLHIVLEAVNTRDNVSTLMGNHELSYLEPSYQCSGFNWTVDAQLTVDVKQMMRQQLNTWIEREGFLLTHAGVTKPWIPGKQQDTPIAYLEIAPNEALYQIGHSRGGSYNVGGPLWCDYHDDFEPITGVKQVFGHTAHKKTGESSGIRTRDDENFCIDCLDRVNEVLEINNGVAKIVTF